MKSFLLFLLFCSFLYNVLGLPNDCKCRSPAFRRIFDGEDGTLVPYQVSVQYKNHICHGIILDEQTVISSASCLNGLPEKEITIVAGIDNLNQRKASNTFKIASITLPEGYDTDVNENNTAMLKLTDKLNLVDGQVEKACIRMFDKKFKKATFYGFGSDQQHKLNLSIADGETANPMPEPTPTNQIKRASFSPIEDVDSKTHWLVQPSSHLNQDSVCIMDEGGSLSVTESGKIYTIGLADEALLSNDNSDVNLAIMCIGKSAFIKFSSIDFFIKQFDTSNMCLFYN